MKNHIYLIVSYTEKEYEQNLKSSINQSLRISKPPILKNPDNSNIIREFIIYLRLVIGKATFLRIRTVELNHLLVVGSKFVLHGLCSQHDSRNQH